MTEHISEYSASRSSRSMNRFMILACAIFVFALCTNYSAAAQNPNLLEQMEGDFNELSNKAVSWSMYPATDTDTIAQDTYDIGLRSECADWVLEPEDGYIEIIKYELPQGDIPLWIDQEWLDQFCVVVEVYGGYELLESYLWLEQKGEYYCIEIVELRSWTEDCSEFYYYGLKLPDGVTEISFDANNFPEVSPPFSLKHDPAYDDLQKEIYAYFFSLWTGCDLESQEFLISSVHSNIGVLSYVSPFLLYIR